ARDRRRIGVNGVGGSPREVTRGATVTYGPSANPTVPSGTPRTTPLWLDCGYRTPHARPNHRDRSKNARQRAALRRATAEPAGQRTGDAQQARSRRAILSRLRPASRQNVADYGRR